MSERSSNLGGEATEVVPDSLRQAAPDSGDLEARQARAAVARALFSGGAPDADPPRVGRYEILDRLGAGGMGVVYRARDPELERVVALKLLAPGGAADETARRRMVREARSLARLSHPNVVQVYDVGTRDEQVFVAMEYVAGRDLAEWIAGQSKRDGGGVEMWRAALRLFVEAARGLQAAHDEGLVHRDFKPANVLVGDDGRVRVVDFGLARPMDMGIDGLDAATTQTGALVGTPVYMSPEQFEGSPADANSDQFSFCVSLFQALFGARPFLGDNLASYVSNVVQGRVVRPNDLPADMPSEILGVLEQGLRVDPARRHASMAGLADALEGLVDPAQSGALSSSGAAATSPGRSTSAVAETGGSRRGLLMALGAVAAVASFALWFSTVRGSTESADAAPASMAVAPGPGSSPTSSPASDPANDRAGAETPSGGDAADGPPGEAGAVEGGDGLATGVGAASGEAQPVPSEDVDSIGAATGASDPEGAAKSESGASASKVPRDSCAFHEDSYRLLRRSPRKATKFRADGQCYTCRVERRKSRIARLSPTDCGNYLICAPADEGSCG